MLNETSTQERPALRGTSDRRCIVGGDALPTGEGVRFVVGPEGAIVPDILGKLPGRGLWVRADRSLVEAAVSKRRFARAARQAVSVPVDLPDQVERLLTKRCIDLIALARRAGEAVAGFEKARSWLSTGTGALLVEASDGASAGRAKIGGIAGDVPRLDMLLADELGQAFGRERAVHVVLANGGLADKLRQEARRLEGFRSVGGEWGEE